MGSVRQGVDRISPLYPDTQEVEVETDDATKVKL